jgi:NADH:ubiquinone oxidoreductase subunit H
LITWVRITFCRFRYDILIITSWKVLLPFSLLIFILCVFIII